MFKFHNINHGFSFDKWGYAMNENGFRIDDVSKEDGFSLVISYKLFDQIMLLSVGLYCLTVGLAVFGLIPAAVNYILLPFIFLWGAYSLIVRVVFQRILLNLAVAIYHKFHPEKFEITPEGNTRLNFCSHN